MSYRRHHLNSFRVLRLGNRRRGELSHFVRNVHACSYNVWQFFVYLTGRWQEWHYNTCNSDDISRTVACRRPLNWHKNEELHENRMNTCLVELSIRIMAWKDSSPFWLWEILGETVKFKIWHPKIDKHSHYTNLNGGKDYRFQKIQFSAPCKILTLISSQKRT